MLEARAHAASVEVLEAGLTNEYNWWVSGGLDVEENPLKTSEVRWLNGSWTQGPQLPVKVSGHCVVQLRRDLSLLIGGRQNPSNYVYDWVDKKWASFPSLQTLRHYHGCGMIRNNIDGAEYVNDVIVSGGLTSSDEASPLASVEIYDAALQKWKIGPDFEYTLFGHVIVQYNPDQILSVGGATEFGATQDIWSLSKSDLSQWKRFGNSKKLQLDFKIVCMNNSLVSAIIPRMAHVAFLVPKISFACEGDETDQFDEKMIYDQELIETLTME